MPKKDIDISQIRHFSLGNFGVKLGAFLEFVFRWKVHGTKPEANKAIFVGAPHTSNWDLPLMFLTAMKLKLPVYFMMKDNVFWWPLSIIWKRVGGIPVNRRDPGNLVKTMVQAFEQREHMYLVIATEGTRKGAKHWKTGFYWMAKEANVPIVYGHCDRKNRHSGVGDAYLPTGDIVEDFKHATAYYGKMVPYYEPKLPPKDLKRENEKGDSEKPSGPAPIPSAS